MSEELRKLFAELRELERSRAPRFRELLNRRVTSPPRGVRLRALVWSAITVLLVGVLLVTRRERPAQPDFGNLPISNWRAPTDFLLKTPGIELIESTPRFAPPEVPKGVSS